MSQREEIHLLPALGNDARIKEVPYRRRLRRRHSTSCSITDVYNAERALKLPRHSLEVSSLLAGTKINIWVVPLLSYS